MKVFHRGTLSLVAATLVAACCACGPSATERARPELLTANEAMSGSPAVLPEPYWREVNGCRADEGHTFPRIGKEDPNLITFNKGQRWITLAVWDHDSYKYNNIVVIMNHAIRTPYCTLGPKAKAALEGRQITPADEWRVYPLDFGQSTAAFRSVTWRLKDVAPAPPAPVKGEEMLIYSTARAYGIVNGKLVRVEISHHDPEPPSEQELRALWDAQVAKIKFHDAVTHNHQVQSGRNAQSGQNTQSGGSSQSGQSAQSAQSAAADPPTSQ